MARHRPQNTYAHAQRRPTCPRCHQREGHRKRAGLCPECWARYLGKPIKMPGVTKGLFP
jgi:hypothetical protein